MGTIYSPRVTDDDVEAAFTNKTDTIDPAVQAALDQFALDANERRKIAMTTVLEEFLKNDGYDGHSPQTVILEVSGGAERVPMLILHETLRLVQLVFVNSKTLGRTYGAIDLKKNFEPMSIDDIEEEFGEVAIRNMATMLILGQHMDHLSVE